MVGLRVQAQQLLFENLKAVLWEKSNQEILCKFSAELRCKRTECDTGTFKFIKYLIVKYKLISLNCHPLLADR